MLHCATGKSKLAAYMSIKKKMYNNLEQNEINVFFLTYTSSSFDQLKVLYYIIEYIR